MLLWLLRSSWVLTRAWQGHLLLLNSPSPGPRSFTALPTDWPGQALQLQPPVSPVTLQLHDRLCRGHQCGLRVGVAPSLSGSANEPSWGWGGGAGRPVPSGQSVPLESRSVALLPDDIKVKQSAVPVLPGRTRAASLPSAHPASLPTLEEVGRSLPRRWPPLGAG